MEDLLNQKKIEMNTAGETPLQRDVRSLQLACAKAVDACGGAFKIAQENEGISILQLQRKLSDPAAGCALDLVEFAAIFRSTKSDIITDALAEIYIRN